jgi:tRNA 2-thiouridine synthesizing protein A
MDEDAPAELDLRGLKCPMPVLRTRKAMRRLAVGRSLAVVCTDPLAAIDIPHLAREDGHHLVSIEHVGEASRFVLRKARAERC